MANTQPLLPQTGTANFPQQYQGCKQVSKSQAPYYTGLQGQNPVLPGQSGPFTQQNQLQGYNLQGQNLPQGQNFQNGPIGNTFQGQPQALQNGTFGNIPLYGGQNVQQALPQYIPQVQQQTQMGPPSFNTPQRIVSQRVVQNSPQIQVLPQPTITSPVQQQIIQQSPQPQQQQASVVHNVEHVPVIHELHHVNRPINVVSVDEIEGPWRSKVLLLEKQLIELQLMMKKGPQREIQTKQVIVEDEGKIRELQAELERLQAILRENQVEIDNLQSQINEATFNLENAEEQASEQVSAQQEELAKWKKKFSDMNKKYHDIEEDITMTEAQIESIQKRKQVVTTTSTVKMTSGSTQQMRDGDIRKSGFSNRNY